MPVHRKAPFDPDTHCALEKLNVNPANLGSGFLVVDLDAALLRSNLTLESLLALLKERPFSAIAICARFLVGKSGAVDALEARRPIAADGLPYVADTIRRVQEARARGSHVVLVSRRYREYALRVAAHLELFDEVIVSPPGDSTATHVDSAVQGLIARGARYLDGAEVPPLRSPVHAWIRAIRLHQWMKNALLFVPLLASHRVREHGLIADEVLAFFAFGCCASSVYLLNDLFDLEDDRHHPSKRLRALAAGDVAAGPALCVMLALLAAAFALSGYLLAPRFVAALGSYYLITLSYSLALKRVMMLDVVLLASLYTLRIIAGAYAIGGQLTFWMLAFSMFIFTSLALAKRYAELHDARAAGRQEKARGRGYFTRDLGMISALGAASGYLAVMVLALYIQDVNTMVLYRHPKLIWFACPLLLFWVGRTWMLTHRGEMHDDPVVFALTDRTSIVIALLFGVIFSLAA